MQITINGADSKLRRRGAVHLPAREIADCHQKLFPSIQNIPSLFSPLTMGPEKAGDICQTQMAHLENDCASVYKESDRVNREGLDIYVHWKLLISAVTT